MITNLKFLNFPYFSLMLRKLLIITGLFTAVAAHAQEGLIPMYVPSTTPRDIPDNNDKSIDYTKMGAPLPDLKVVTLPQGKVKKGPNDVEIKNVIVPSKKITNNTVKNNANLILMIFNPNCGHCEDQTDTLEKYIFLFKKSKLVLACAPLMGPFLEQFEKDHHTNQYPTIQIGLDSSNLIKKTFLYTNLPQINIYDKKRKLIKTFIGGATIDSLKSYIE